MSAPLPALLRAEELRRRFQDRDVVAGVSLSLVPGEWVSVVGPSGCGKTTLMQMLGLLDRPSSGTLHIQETDAWSQTDAARTALRRQTIGFVFQQNNLLEIMNTRDNVAFPRWYAGGSRRDANRAADELLERFGLAARAQAPVNELSTGEAQRAAIARALVNQPRVVLADEPTGALDSEAARVVMDALADARGLGAAVVMVTHDVQIAARADRSITLRDGRVVA